MIRHGRAFDLLAAGALLDDLDGQELERFETHQAGCRRCHRLTGELRSSLADLALLAAPRRPPATLGPTILAAIRTAGSPVAVAAIVRPAIRHRETRLELDRVSAESALERASRAIEQAAMAVAVAPDHATVALVPEPLAPAAEAVVVYRAGHPDAYIVAHDVPATPAGTVYQLWVADAAGVHPLGTFTFDGRGTFVAPFDRDLAGSSAVMMTLEPTGGAIGGPGPQVVFGTL
jgi:Anti-sigma-K factor rskA, C-terminal